MANEVRHGAGGGPPSTTLACAQQAARLFVAEEAGFAQVYSIDRAGCPVGRSMTAFLNEDWSVDLVQRRLHARLAQWRHDPHACASWVGSPAPGATNEHPHVFDIDTLPPRAVFIRGEVRFLDADETERIYRREIEVQRAHGNTRAPLRDAAGVERDLTGIRLIPYRVRLEGFGVEAQSFDFTL